MNESLARLITEHRIHEVECAIPDMTGIARAKILPKDLFRGAGERALGLRQPHLRHPDSEVGRCIAPGREPRARCRREPLPWEREHLRLLV